MKKKEIFPFHIFSGKFPKLIFLFFLSPLFVFVFLQNTQHRDTKALDVQSRRENRGVLADGENYQIVVNHMLESSDPYRTCLFMTDKTKRINQQCLISQMLLEEFESRYLVVSTYNNKAITVKLTRALRSFVLNDTNEDGNLLLNTARKIAKKWLDKRGKSWSDTFFTPTKDENDDADGGFNMKRLPIGIVLEALRKIKGSSTLGKKALRRLCSRVVIITGEIGGRGISYHDNGHRQILTDMMYACNVSNKTQVTAHSESLVQALGRLCCLYTQKWIEEDGTVVRLWAPKPVHQIHISSLKEIHDCSVIVAQDKSYDGIRHRPKLQTGVNRRGVPLLLRCSRPSISRFAPRGTTLVDMEATGLLSKEREAKRGPIKLAPTSANQRAVNDLQASYMAYIKLKNDGYTKGGDKKLAVVRIPIRDFLDFSRLKECPPFFDGQSPFWTIKKQQTYDTNKTPTISWTGHTHFTHENELWLGNDANMNHGSIYTRQKEFIKWCLENKVLKPLQQRQQSKKRSRNGNDDESSSDEDDNSDDGESFLSATKQRRTN